LDRSSIYVGKMIVNLILMMLAELMIITIFIFLFNVNVMERFFWQLASLLFGTTGFIIVGTLIAAISVNLRAKEILGPLLMFPVVVPVVIAAVSFSDGLINGESMEGLYAWLKILIAFDIIYLVVSLLVFEKLVEE